MRISLNGQNLFGSEVTYVSTLCFAASQYSKFLGLSTESRMKALNDHLAGRSYIGGFTFSQADVEVFRSLPKPPLDQYFHVVRWYRHIAAIWDCTQDDAKTCELHTSLVNPRKGSPVGSLLGQLIDNDNHDKINQPGVTQEGMPSCYINSLCNPPWSSVIAIYLEVSWSYISFDILRRILMNYFKYDVFYCMNITDVDDKIIKRARQNHLFEQYKEKNVFPTQLLQDTRTALK
eukprot:g46263.t1